MYEMKVLSSLIKVFSEEEPIEDLGMTNFSMFKNETFSFQIAYTKKEYFNEYVKVAVESDIKQCIRLREVILVPSRYPIHTHLPHDDYYLKTKPGMFPDLLRDLDDSKIQLVSYQWHSLWVDIEPCQDIKPGNHLIKFSLINLEDQEICSVETNVMIYPHKLLENKLIHTEWFHGDCIANYYGEEVFSERHWQLMENFIEIAVKRQCNMILTPIFTPPLDTVKGGERTTIQLIDIEVTPDGYCFNFDKFRRWVVMCQKVGMKYFELSHLFTQWGAIATPKIMAIKEGRYQRIFGWETPATSREYKVFLEQFLPTLIKEIKALNIQENTYFHISDEPELLQYESYKAAKEIVAPYLKDFKIIDAMSSYGFYELGVIDHPICATNHIQTFIDHKVKNMWSYYCTAQYNKVCNRFMAMPSARNRAYGLQLFKYDIEGILHWGYNFYNSQYSVYPINPYFDTDASMAFPSGDSFLVYPGANGKPEESIRIMVQNQAINDLRALILLAKYLGKKKTIELMEEGIEPITFENYPHNDLYYVKLRNKVNQLIHEYVVNEYGR